MFWDDKFINRKVVSHSRRWTLSQVFCGMHGWDQVKEWILKGKKSHSKCISKPFFIAFWDIWILKHCWSLKNPTHVHGCETWTLLADSEKKIPGLQGQAPKETSLHLLLWAQDQQLGVGEAKSASWWAHMNLFWQLLRLTLARSMRVSLKKNNPGHLGGRATL